LKSREFVPANGLEAGLAAVARESRHGLIQFKTIPTEAQRAALRKLGVEMLTYIPDRAFLARLPGDLRPVVRNSVVRSISTVRPDDKAEARVVKDGVNPFARKGENIRLTVLFFSDVEPRQAEAVVSANGGTVIQALPDFHMLDVEIPEKALPQLLADDAVQWVEDVFENQTLNDGAAIAMNVDDVNAAPYGLDGTGAKVGEWDQGLAGSHQDFGTRVTAGDSAAVAAHSTHVAGTVMGSGLLSAANGGTPLQWKGMAPNASLVSYDWNSFLGEYSSAINVHGIRLATNSWQNGGNGSYTAQSGTLDTIVNGLYNHRIPIFWAAGNNRNPTPNHVCDVDLGGTPATNNDAYDCIVNLAAAKNTITVGATNSNDKSMTVFSSWGPTNDGRLKPEIVAPGCAVGAAIRSAVPVDAYGNSCGTSMSTPAAAGAAALLVQRYNQLCPAGDLLPSSVKALLIHTATDLDDATTWFNPGPDYPSGYGHVDAKRAVDMVPFHVEDSVVHGGTKTYSIVLAAQQTLKVTLAWDDIPAAANAAVSLVDDLDLEVVGPDGSHLPWVLNPASPTANATRAVDNRNVVEQVVVDNAPAGTWTIKVKGTNIPGASANQDFSLVNENLQLSSCAGPVPAADLWGTDIAPPYSPVDVGTEPSGPGPMWISQDIRVRLGTVDDGVTHENPELGQTNNVFVTVRNRGTQTGPYANVMLYWAHASTGLSWPTDWHQIGSGTAVNVPAGGSTVVGPIPWNPVGTGHYCLYARMVTFNEPIGPETTDVNLTTMQNNEVIWKNVTVVDNLAVAPYAGSFIVRNIGREKGTFDLKFQEPAAQQREPFLGRGEIVVDLGRPLYDLWRRAGGKRHGLEALGGTKFRVVDPKGAELLGIPLDRRAEFTVGIQITGKALSAGSRYRFDIVQTPSGKSKAATGGVSFDIQGPPR
jgi:hypothetical protein